MAVMDHLGKAVHAHSTNFPCSKMDKYKQISNHFSTKELLNTFINAQYGIISVLLPLFLFSVFLFVVSSTLEAGLLNKGSTFRFDLIYKCQRFDFCHT